MPAEGPGQPAAPGAAPYSIVIVTWQSADDLRRLVESMTEHLPGDPELVAVDNASTDGPEEAARSWRGPTRFVRRDDNAGFGAAANVGVRAARGETVVLLNPDTELIDATLGRLAAAAAAKRALVGPRLLNADGSWQPSASGPVVGPWPWAGALLPGGLQPRRLLARTEPWRLTEEARVSWLSAACLAAPREVLLRLGPFDPALHLYGEDMDLGLRAAAAGVDSWFCPVLCTVVHHQRGSASQRWREGPARAMETARRAVVARAHGPAREGRAWRAHRLNLRLRASVKRLARRDAAWERALLEAGDSLRRAPALPAPPRPPT